jgi:hypothetical protein
MSMPCAMQVLYRDDQRRSGPRLGLEQCPHRLFFAVAFPEAANFAAAPRGVAFDAWPQVLV